MQIYLDSADHREIEKWSAAGIIDGVTTNPSILFKDGVFDAEEGAQRLAKLLGERPLSVEVTSDDPTEMLGQGRAIARHAANIVVKIPVTNSRGESCLSVIHALSREAIAVNTTAILSFNQAMLAAKAGAAYVSIFAGRIADEGNDPAAVIRNVRTWLDEWESSARIIVGSIRTVMDIQSAALAGAHIITIPPQFLPKMVDHKYTRETVLQFNRDAERALAQMSEARTAAAGSGSNGR
ncbi:MAG TPA: transaldolase family protein [Candidatus Limnocylindrales bacterium]|nr:transaldolase family protein [Candidatus Limnocylindrales bacterium]